MPEPGVPDRARRRVPSGLEWAVYAGVLAWVGLLLGVPLLALLVQTFSDLSAVIEELRTAEALHALALSLGVAAVAVLVNGSLGVAGALVFVRQRFWGKAILDALVDLPLSLSPVMTGLALLLVYGREGVLSPLLDALGWKVAFAFPSILIATLFVTLPFPLREAALVLEEVGDGEEQAATTLGAGHWTIFWRITLPNLRGALVRGATLTAARALGEFGAVLVVGGSIANHTQTATTYIHAALEERHESAASGMALILAGAAVALLLSLQRQRGPR